MKTRKLKRKQEKEKKNSEVDKMYGVMRNKKNRVKKSMSLSKLNKHKTDEKQKKTRKRNKTRWKYIATNLEIR